mgnify:CR=1 FL=1
MHSITADTEARADAASASPALVSTALASTAYLLHLGDNALIHGQRLAEWCGHGPALEEDIAMSNIALDCIGQARLLLSLAGEREGAGRDEDALAYLRDESAFLNYTLLELPNGDSAHDDYAITIVRGLLHESLQIHLWPALARSADTALAAIAARSINEARAHFRHFSQWVIRLGDGTEESHSRTQAALERLYPYTNEFWTADPAFEPIAATDPGPHANFARAHELKPQWEATVSEVLAQAGLARPAASGFESRGKSGQHSEHLGPLLAEMQVLARAHPGARW